MPLNKKRDSTDLNMSYNKSSKILPDNENPPHKIEIWNPIDISLDNDAIIKQSKLNENYINLRKKIFAKRSIAESITRINEIG